MKTIHYNPPLRKGHFIYVAPFPGQITYEKLMEDPDREFIIEGQKIKATLMDAIVYPLQDMSDFHCRWAYGLPKQDMMKHLKETFETLQDTSRIGFYLFRILYSK